MKDAILAVQLNISKVRSGLPKRQGKKARVCSNHIDQVHTDLSPIQIKISDVADTVVFYDLSSTKSENVACQRTLNILFSGNICIIYLLRKNPSPELASARS